MYYRSLGDTDATMMGVTYPTYMTFNWSVLLTTVAYEFEEIILYFVYYLRGECLHTQLYYLWVCVY